MSGIANNSSPKKRKSYAKMVDYYKTLLKNSEERNIDSLINEKRRLTRGMLQKLNEQNAFVSLSKECPSRNSIIIINDSDNEASERDAENASLSIIECSPTTLPSSSQRKLEMKESQKSAKKRKLSRTVVNLSSIQSSNIQLPRNSENIAPSQTEDDVIELWSSLKSSRPNKRKRSRYCYDETNERDNFVIDTRPNLKNLEYLKTDTEPVRKKPCHIFDKFTLSSNKSQKRRQYTNNEDLNLLQSNTQSCEEEAKPVISGEQNSPDLNHKLKRKYKLREIIVDGCNVGMAHTNHRTFSAIGIKLIVDYFKKRGHVVKVFLPNHLRKYALLEELYKDGVVVFTPSRRVNGRQITPYDDRFILEYATACGGIVISEDQYRDLYKEKPEWRDTITYRLLTPTFVGDYVMFPEDPLGKSGPNLETFLRH